jgi:tetratricopeptide (TPR) repeat protein
MAVSHVGALLQRYSSLAEGMMMTSGPSLKLLAVIAMSLTVTLAIRAVAVEQPRTPILIPNIQEPEEMRVAPFPMRNTVSTPADRILEEAIQVAQAKAQSLSPYEAISDFTDAIKMEGRELLKSKAYEGRADAYMQTREWDLAIKDLTTAISLQIAGSVLVGNVSQFRAIYPEYGVASDDAIAQKLNQTFYPDIKYEDFSQRFLTGHALLSAIIADLYIKRSNTYLRKGDWHSALLDFGRATNGFPDYAVGIDRWRQFDETYNTHTYVDLKNFDDAGGGSVKLWIKQTHGGNDAPGPYELYRFELNCSAEKVRTLSWAEYNASATPMKSGEGGRWGSIWPETLGKILADGVCGNRQPGPKPNEAG